MGCIDNKSANIARILQKVNDITNRLFGFLLKRRYPALPKIEAPSDSPKVGVTKQDATHLQMGVKHCTVRRTECD